MGRVGSGKVGSGVGCEEGPLDSLREARLGLCLKDQDGIPWDERRKLDIEILG